jgi:hypothetical protein
MVIPVLWLINQYRAEQRQKPSRAPLRTSSATSESVRRRRVTRAE